jgi:predicted ATPase/DNA-binding SARP family transcriptional activator
VALGARKGSRIIEAVRKRETTLREQRVRDEARGPPGLFYGLLGPVAVWRDGRPLALGTPQQRRLLALLLLHRNTPVSTDRIVDALWHEDVPANAVQTVRTYVSRLRSILGGEPSPLLTESGDYRFATKGGQVDVDGFEALAQDGREALDAGDAALATSRLEEALALVRGPPLAGLEYDDFARYEIERLEELRLLVLEDLGEARLLQGRHAELVPELRATVDQHPLRERLWGQLMLALYRSGRQSDALQVYREARSLLAEELGLEPARELRELERLILLQDRTLEHGAVGRLHGVPRYSTSFVGRDGDIATVRALIGRERLVTIAGAAGSGKTRLASETSLLVRESFAEGVWWVDLASAAPGLAEAAIADALAVRLDSARSPADVVVSRLRGARLLLVLDNCEHLTSDLAPLLARVVSECEPATILATSREPIRVAGERVHRLPPLSVPPDALVGASRVLEYEASRLLVARASAAAASVTLGESTATAIAEIVTRLDGLPLAIELASGKLRSVSLPELARALESGLDLLASGDRSAPFRQRSLEAALAWSFDLLSSDERVLLERIAVFPAGFDLAAARAVGANGELAPERVLSVLAELVEKSLVTAELGDETRYRLLAMVRAFALERAREDGELEQASTRHRDHFADLADELFWQLIGPELGTWLERARRDHANHHAALHWSLERGEGDSALRHASALSMYWFRTGRLREWRELLGRALALADGSSRWRPRALVGQAWSSGLAGEPDAEQCAREAVRACECAGRELLGLALAALVQCQIAGGQLDDADATIRRVREVFVETTFAEGPHLVEELTGEVLHRRGDIEGALVHLRRSRDHYRELRGTLDAGWTLVRLAQVALEAGKSAESAAAAGDAVEDFRVRGDPRGLASALVVLGRTYAARSEPERAHTLVHEALELAREWEYPVELARARAALDELGLAAATA